MFIEMSPAWMGSAGFFTKLCLDSAGFFTKLCLDSAGFFTKLCLDLDSAGFFTKLCLDSAGVLHVRWILQPNKEKLFFHLIVVCLYLWRMCYAIVRCGSGMLLK